MAHESSFNSSAKPRGPDAPEVPGEASCPPGQSSLTWAGLAADRRAQVPLTAAQTRGGGPPCASELPQTLEPGLHVPVREKLLKDKSQPQRLCEP